MFAHDNGHACFIWRQIRKNLFVAIAMILFMFAVVLGIAFTCQDARVAVNLKITSPTEDDLFFFRIKSYEGRKLRMLFPEPKYRNCTVQMISTAGDRYAEIDLDKIDVEDDLVAIFPELREAHPSVMNVLLEFLGRMNEGDLPSPRHHTYNEEGPYVEAQITHHMFHFRGRK